MKKYTLIIGLTVLLSACKVTQTVSWPTGTSTGTLTLPDQTQKVALLNRIQVGYAPTAADQSRIYPNSLSGMNGLLTGFYNEVYNRHFLTFTGTMNDYKRKADGNFPDTLSASQIQAVSKGADIVVSLAMMNHFYEDEYVVEIRKQKLTDNTYKEVDMIVGKRHMKLEAGWRVYHVATGRVIEEYVTSEEYTYESEAEERQRCTELLDLHLDKELKNMGLRQGHEYASRVSPTKHFTYRSVYVSGSPQLESAASEVKDDHWSEATKIWESALETEKNSKRKAMLYHNLAIASEKAGNMTQAKEYARLAANHHKLGLDTQRVVGF